MDSLGAQTVKNLPVMQETWVQSLVWDDPPEKGTGYFSLSTWQTMLKKNTGYSSILAWRIPGTEETVGLQSIVSKRVGHDWATDTWMYLKDEKGSVWFSQQKMMLITLAPISDRGDDEEAGKQQLL